MKIEITFCKGFTLNDWRELKVTLDSYMFKEFSKSTHPDNSFDICTMSGPHIANGNLDAPEWGNKLTYEVKISNSTYLQEQEPIVFDPENIFKPTY